MAVTELVQLSQGVKIYWRNSETQLAAGAPYMTPLAGALGGGGEGGGETDRIQKMMDEVGHVHITPYGDRLFGLSLSGSGYTHHVYFPRVRDPPLCPPSACSATAERQYTKQGDFAVGRTDNRKAAWCSKQAHFEQPRWLRIQTDI